MFEAFRSCRRPLSQMVSLFSSLRTEVNPYLELFLFDLFADPNISLDLFSDPNISLDRFRIPYRLAIRSSFGQQLRSVQPTPVRS